MKKYKILILLILFLLLCGCERGTVHEYEEFIDYVDYKDCEYSVLCGLKDKYDVISDEEGTDKAGREKRTLTLKIKNTDLTFTVTSASVCTGSIDASCFEHTYELIDDYNLKASEYYLAEVKKSLNYNDELCDTTYANINCNYAFNIKTQEELNLIIKYMNQFLDIANSLDFKFIESKQNYFYLTFDKTNYKSLRIDIIYKDGKYTYKYEDEYKPIDDEVSTYINNYLQEQNLFLA